MSFAENTDSDIKLLGMAQLIAPANQIILKLSDILGLNSAYRRVKIEAAIETGGAALPLTFFVDGDQTANRYQSLNGNNNEIITLSIINSIYKIFGELYFNEPRFGENPRWIFTLQYFRMDPNDVFNGAHQKNYISRHVNFIDTNIQAIGIGSNGAPNVFTPDSFIRAIGYSH